LSGAARAIARRAWGDGRTRTLSFGLFFGLISLVQVAGYENSYPTVADRIQFAENFGDNKAVRLFYGVPHDLLTVGGYAAWRVGGVLAIFAAVWGIFAAVRAQRAEEDDGRAELVLAAPLGRRLVFRAGLAGVGAGVALLWLATWLGLLAGGLAAGASAYLALEIAAAAAVFVGVGSLASQLAPTRRQALGLGMAVFAAAFVLRIVADTAGALEWLRWATPLGWAEEMRPFTGAQPAALALILAVTVALLAVAERIALSRDVGTGLLASADSAPPRDRLLSSPTALALRGERGLMIGWFAGIGVYAIVVGLLANTFNAHDLSQSVREQLQKFGGASIVTPQGALGFYFLFFGFAISLFACAQISAARHEEAESRLETIFALPVSRLGWLGGRLALAAGGIAALALSAALLAWAAAATQAAGIGIGEALQAGLNTLPASLLFLGLAALAFALLPRAAAGIAYGLVAVAFCWYLFGALLGAPQWTLDLSPFQHVAPVPAQPWKTADALAMVAVGTAAMAAALAAFRRRDVLGA
jgi:polyether ionophore transport system permease protein